MARAALFAAVIIVGIGAASWFLISSSGDQISEDDAFGVPGLDPMTMTQAQNDFFRLTPALLLVVYEAFGAVEEDTIYDTLASVTHGDALDYLYLERVGSMAGGGLDEADQTIHEIKLLYTSALRQDETLNINASWQVIGTVGHAEHLHVRGNTYSADLTVEPVDGAWRITDFELLDVDRDGAGETFEAPPTN